MDDLNLVRIGNIARYKGDFVEISDQHEYKRCRVQLHKKGVILKKRVYKKTEKS